MIYLQDFSNETISNLVHVFYSSSGSGKTVELVGSAVTRNCHLAIVVSPCDGDYKKGSERERRLRREHKRLPDLSFAMTRVIDDNKEAFESLLNTATEDDKLKLVVALDEASACPDLVRSIIHNREEAALCVIALFEYYVGEAAKKID